MEFYCTQEGDFNAYKQVLTEAEILFIHRTVVGEKGKVAYEIKTVKDLTPQKAKEIIEKAKRIISENLPRCPSCKKPIDDHTPVDKTKAIKPGDISICVYCGCLRQFRDDMTLKVMTDEDLAPIPKNRLREIMEAVAVIKKRIKRN